MLCSDLRVSLPMFQVTGGRGHKVRSGSWVFPVCSQGSEQWLKLEATGTRPLWVSSSQANLHSLHTSHFQCLNLTVPLQQSHKACVTNPSFFQPQQYLRTHKDNDYFYMIWKAVLFLVTLRRWWFSGWDPELCGKTEQDALHVITLQSTTLWIISCP